MIRATIILITTQVFGFLKYLLALLAKNPSEKNQTPEANIDPHAKAIFSKTLSESASVPIMTIASRYTWGFNKVMINVYRRVLRNDVTAIALSVIAMDLHLYRDCSALIAYHVTKHVPQIPSNIVISLLFARKFATPKIPKFINITSHIKHTKHTQKT